MGPFFKSHYMGGNLIMHFSGRSIRFMSLNSVDGQSVWLHLSLTHFLVFAKNRRYTADVQWSVLCCPAVCREQADTARKAQVFPDSIFPSANSVTKSQNFWRCLVQPCVQSRVRASAARSGLCPLISTISTRTEIQSLSGSLFKYLTILAGFSPCPLGILISISHISSCAHHFPGHAKKSLCVSTPHPPVRGL